MADSDVVSLAAATPIGTDLLYFVDDPGGTPLDRKVTWAAAALALKGLLDNEVAFEVFGSGTAVATGDGTSGIPIPATMNGFDITDVIATVHDKGITGTTDIQIRRRRAGADVDVLTTKITIGDEFFATDEGVDASNDDLLTGDILYVDVDAVHSGTPPNGLSVAITMRAP